MSFVGNRKYFKYCIISFPPLEVGEVDLSAAGLRTHGSRIQGSRIHGNGIQGNRIHGNHIHGNGIQGNRIHGNHIKGSRVQATREPRSGKPAFREATSEEPPSRETVSVAPVSLGPASMETPSRAAASPIPVLHTCHPLSSKQRSLVSVNLALGNHPNNPYKYPDLTLSAERIRLFHYTCF